MENRFGKHKKYKRKYLLAIGFVLLLLCSAIPTFGETVDLLEIPSKKADWAPHSMLMDIAKVDNRIVVVGERGFILYSDDECSGWIQAEVPASVTLLSVRFPTYDKGWAIGHDGVVLHTEDGGSTWKKQLDGTQIGEMVADQVKQMAEAKHDLLADPEAGLTEEEREKLEFEAEDLDMFLSDAEFFKEQGPIQPLMDMWFKNEMEGIVVGGFGTILSTKDGGATWQPILDRIDNLGKSLHAITRCGDDLFIAGETGRLFRSEDFGQSWQRLESPYVGSFFGILGDPAGGFITAFGLKGNIYTSLDRGETWQRSNTGREVSLYGGAFLSDGSFCLVGGDGAILRSNDRGKTFTALPVRYRGPAASLAEVRKDVLTVVGLAGVSRIEINNPSN